MLRRTLALAAVVLGVLTPVATAATTLNIIPSGQWEPGVSWGTAAGILPADTQAKMYDRLTPLFRDVTDAQLVPSLDGSGFFKSAALLDENDPSLILAEPVSGTAPGAGAVSARIKRDAYGVPHIYADTDDGAIFGAGYVVAEDRSLVLDQARFDGVAALLDVPATPAINLLVKLYSFAPAKKALADITALQTHNIERTGARGRQLLHDIDVYLAGINLWYARNRPTAPRFTRSDIYALNAIKSQFLGQGGGQEAANAEFLDAARQRLGARRGNEAYEDLRGRDDPETVTTTDRSFPYQTKVGVAHPRGMVRLVYGSFRPSGPLLPGVTPGTPGATIATVDGQRPEASNVLIASGSASQTGSPLLVGGPQIGYEYPGLTLEMQLRSPHIDVRGATSAPFPGYLLIGRGEDYAWTLTSADGDIIDTYAETLCGGSKLRYRYKGRCRAMSTVKAGTLSKGTKKIKLSFHRTVHGPVIGYARDRATRKLVALSSKRSSYGRETVDQEFFQQMTFGRVHSARDFVNAASLTPQTFNSFYASARESAFFTSGLLPLRPKGVNPDLPVNGNGDDEWTGFLPKAAHPQVIDPPSGYIVNWNNKPAKDFPASDSRWTEQSLQRDLLLKDELARQPKQTPATVLAAENAAATEDVRIVELWPTLDRMLARGTAPSARAAQLRALLQAWHDAGGSRRDADRDGKIDDPGAAILDAAWTGIANAGLCDRLGMALCNQLTHRNARFQAPPKGQYAGWQQYLWKDLRAMLGDKIAGAYHLRYCGNGKVATCARELWAALDAAGGKLAVQQGNDPTLWRAPEAKEQIAFVPLPLTTLQYTNRPTGIHQVMQFGP